MRIGFDVSNIQRRRAGIGRHSQQLLRALLQFDKNDDYVLHGWSFKVDGPTISSLAGPTARLNVSRIPGFIKRLYWNELRMPPIETLLGPIDIFHSADPSVPPTRRARTVCTVHDLTYMRFPQLFDHSVLMRDKSVRRAVQVANAILVPSHQTKHDLVELLKVPKDKIHPVYISVDRVFTSQVQPDFDFQVRTKYALAKPFILFVGTLEPRKNIERLVSSFELICQESKHDVDLVIVGKTGWLYDGIVKSMSNSRQASRIHYLKYVADAELASLYRQAILFVYPSLYEGYGFPVLEAMASGVPIVTSANSSMREIADGVALLVDPYSIQGIADAMLLLLGDEVRRIEMKQRGLLVSAQLTPEVVAHSVSTLYQSLA